MKVWINITDVENNNNVFDILTVTNEPFSYLGEGKLEITKTQLGLLRLNYAKFAVVEK